MLGVLSYAERSGATALTLGSYVGKLKDSAVKAPLTSSAGKTLVNCSVLGGVSLDEHIAIGFEVKGTSD